MTLETQMAQIEVQAQRDHIESLTKARPLSALGELIWNALDADASEVRISVTTNALDGIEQVLVEDDGCGLPYTDAESAFGHLGGSWKKTADKTRREKRALHGNDGKGRFKAFSLGRRVEWNVCYRGDDATLCYGITGDRANLRAFDISPAQAQEQTQTGTTVTISGIDEDLTDLTDTVQVVEWLAESVEDRQHGVPRIAHLRAAEPSVAFLSVEPLLEDLGTLDLHGIDWVIVGGESGPRARAMEAPWVRSLRDQCLSRQVPFFFKQWGGVRKHETGRELDGRTYDGSPTPAPAAESGRTFAAVCARTPRARGYGSRSALKALHQRSPGQRAQGNALGTLTSNQPNPEGVAQQPM